MAGYSQNHLLAFKLNDVRNALTPEKASRFLKLSLPTTFNFFAWAAGIFSYHAIMGQTGVQGLAALSVITLLKDLDNPLVIGT